MSDTSKFFAVMLVDDNEIDNIINSKMIESTGIAHVVYTHNTASSAIEFLKNISKLPTSADQKLPAYIFLDIDMPMMDGFQFLEEFEKLSEEIRAYCKIIMLTASINPMDKERAENHANFVRYINKPLKEDELLKLREEYELNA